MRKTSFLASTFRHKLIISLNLPNLELIENRTFLSNNFISNCIYLDSLGRIKEKLVSIFELSDGCMKTSNRLFRPMLDFIKVIFCTNSESAEVLRNSMEKINEKLISFIQFTPARVKKSRIR